MKKALMIAMMAVLAAAGLFAHGGHGWRDDGRWRGDERDWRGRHDMRGGHGWRDRQGGIIPVENIPQAAQDFISEYFPESTVQFAGGDFRMYKVVLSDGTEIAFAPDGEWHDIKSYAGIPAGVLPAEVASYAEQTFPGVAIMRAEKKWRGLELKLSNRMEMHFDADGRLLGQRFDY